LGSGASEDESSLASPLLLRKMLPARAVDSKPAAAIVTKIFLMVVQVLERCEKLFEIDLRIRPRWGNARLNYLLARSLMQSLYCASQ